MGQLPNNPAELVVPPPTPKLWDYPATTAIVLGVLCTGIMLILVNKFDPTQGTLAISILVVFAFVGTAIYCLFFTVPNDEITAGVIGGLIAAFGAVMSYWLGKRGEPPGR